MIATNGITLRYGKKVLFEEVTIKFTQGNCYGLIGANGSGKSTFLKILSGQMEANKGEVFIDKGKRLSFLKQDHFQYDQFTVLDTVMQGDETLYKIMKEKEEIYAKPEFTDEDGVKASKLEEEFAELNGWMAETDAATLLNDLGIEDVYHTKLMKDLDGSQKIKVLLAQALFRTPDILLLDEPTNHLDIKATRWLEEFLVNFENTIIVVSHDRYFLNKVCTYIADIDYGKINLYTGNYDFWYESSQLALKQMKEANKKKEERIKELQEFIQRFSANASKSKQATSRKKSLEKIVLDEIKPSTRKYPYIDFKPEKEIGKDVIKVNHLTKIIDGEKVLDDLSFIITNQDKIVLASDSELVKTTFLKILAGEMEPDSGEVIVGNTILRSYFSKDIVNTLDTDENLVEWLRNYSKDPDQTYLRGFLGRMLFSGEEALKKISVLSGGEKVRCAFSKMMLSGANVLFFDEPTNHLDMESITSLNNGMSNFKGVILFASRDHQLMQTVANRVFEFSNGKLADYQMTYDEYLDTKG